MSELKINELENKVEELSKKLHKYEKQLSNEVKENVPVEVEKAFARVSLNWQKSSSRLSLDQISNGVSILANLLVVVGVWIAASQYYQAEALDDKQVAIELVNGFYEQNFTETNARLFDVSYYMKSNSMEEALEKVYFDTDPQKNLNDLRNDIDRVSIKYHQLRVILDNDLGSNDIIQTLICEPSGGVKGWQKIVHSISQLDYYAPEPFVKDDIDFLLSQCEHY